MLRLLLHWILNALALLVVSHFVEGFEVSNVVSAFIAVVVIGLLNATVGLFLKIITLPLGILSFGLFFLVINAVILIAAGLLGLLLLWPNTERARLAAAAAQPKFA